MVKVLVVEDEADIRHLLVEQLEEKGYQVRKADNGAVALQRVKEEIPDVIFVDILMPVMDGLLLVSELRENPDTSGIPVVLVTAINLSGVIPRARELGIKLLLAKPWEPKSLDLVLNQALVPTKGEWDIPAV
ncbi:MAG: response regulator [SAR202 cluster bacterium]|nr:response regulator [SAR202 cluster bacterium]